MPRSIKVDDETYEWLQRRKELTGVPIQRIIKDLVDAHKQINAYRNPEE